MTDSKKNEMILEFCKNHNREIKDNLFICCPFCAKKLEKSEINTMNKLLEIIISDNTKKEI